MLCETARRFAVNRPVAWHHEPFNSHLPIPRGQHPVEQKYSAEQKTPVISRLVCWRGVDLASCIHDIGLILLVSHASNTKLSKSLSAG